jgi:hypothetical protein
LVRGGAGSRVRVSFAHPYFGYRLKKIWNIAPTKHIGF